MTELLPKLISVVTTLSIAYCCFKAHESKSSPVRACVCSFIVAIASIFLVFISTVEMERVFCGGLGCHFALVGTVHLITNDSEKYEKDPKVWVNSMSFLIAITGFLALVMDYPNTKSILHSLIIGFATGFLGGIFDIRRSKEVKEENL